MHHQPSPLFHKKVIQRRGVFIFRPWQPRAPRDATAELRSCGRVRMAWLPAPRPAAAPPGVDLGCGGAFGTATLVVQSPAALCDMRRHRNFRGGHGRCRRVDKHGLDRTPTPRGRLHLVCARHPREPTPSPELLSQVLRRPESGDNRDLEAASGLNQHIHSLS